MMNHRVEPGGPVARTTWARFAREIKTLATSEVGGRAMLLFGVLLALVLGINGLNVLNSYVGRDFMTAIEQRNMSEFVRRAAQYLGVFALSTIAAVIYRFTEERLGLLWRAWLTGRLLDAYLNNRAYHCLRDREEVGNPDQRIADDTRTFVTMTLSFVLLLLNGTFTILAFSGVLFLISPRLWIAAVVYATLGSLVALRLGRPLVRMNYDQADRDASLRAELIHLRENSEAIAVTGGEPRMRVALQKRLDGVVTNLTNIIRVNRNLGYFTTGYNYMIQIIPALLVGPLFIRGQVEFGVIPQSAMAFAHLLGAFSLIVTQIQSISSYGAVLARLSSLADALEQVAGPETVPITMAETSGRLSYENLSLRSPHGGQPLINSLSISIERGTRLLVTSPENAPLEALFFATVGLWNAGAGVIARPPGDRVLFVPVFPYLGRGSLRDVLRPTSSGPPLTDDAITAVLGDLGAAGVLAYAGSLDQEHDWQKLVGPGERLLLMLARVALACPEFAFLYRVDELLGGADMARALQAFRARSITYVTFSDSDALAAEHDVVLRLEPGGAWNPRPDSRRVSA
jgi:putative ATP-binding cassette transporter